MTHDASARASREARGNIANVYPLPDSERGPGYLQITEQTEIGDTAFKFHLY